MTTAGHEPMGAGCPPTTRRSGRSGEGIGVGWIFEDWVSGNVWGNGLNIGVGWTFEDWVSGNVWGNGLNIGVGWIFEDWVSGNVWGNGLNIGVGWTFEDWVSGNVWGNGLNIGVGWTFEDWVSGNVWGNSKGTGRCLHIDWLKWPTNRYRAKKRKECHQPTNHKLDHSMCVVLEGCAVIGSLIFCEL